jgi:hypothetical protein
MSINGFAQVLGGAAGQHHALEPGTWPCASSFTASIAVWLLGQQRRPAAGWRSGGAHRRDQPGRRSLVEPAAGVLSLSRLQHDGFIVDDPTIRAEVGNRFRLTHSLGCEMGFYVLRDGRLASSPSTKPGSPTARQSRSGHSVRRTKDWAGWSYRRSSTCPIPRSSTTTRWHRPWRRDGAAAGRPRRRRLSGHVPPRQPGASLAAAGRYAPREFLAIAPFCRGRLRTVAQGGLGPKPRPQRQSRPVLLTNLVGLCRATSAREVARCR